VDNEKLLLCFTIVTMVVMSILFLRPPYKIENVAIGVISLTLTLRLAYNIWRAKKSKQDEDPDSKD
jgi:uncharacterized membrane protein YqjE